MSALSGHKLNVNKRDITMSRSQVNNNSILEGINVMPMKGSNTNNGSNFSMMRRIFQKSSKQNPENNTEKRGKIVYIKIMLNI